MRRFKGIKKKNFTMKMMVTNEQIREFSSDSEK